MTDWASINYAVVDVEGNGQQPPDLVELAVVPIVGGEIGEPTSWLVQPDRPIKHFATRIHGITTQDVAEEPSLEMIADEVRTSLDVSALVAHNAHVDIGVLQRELTGWQPPEVFDTLKLAKRLAPDQPGYKLGMLVKAFNLAEGLPDDLVPHRATYDALVAARLFVRLVTITEGHPLTLESLRGGSSKGNGREAPSLFLSRTRAVCQRGRRRVGSSSRRPAPPAQAMSRRRPSSASSSARRSPLRSAHRPVSRSSRRLSTVRCSARCPTLAHTDTPRRTGSSRYASGRRQ
jgi:DNA polymerase III epsilon subunit-like protein